MRTDRDRPPERREWLWFLLLWAVSAAAFAGSVWLLRCGVAWVM